MQQQTLAAFQCGWASCIDEEAIPMPNREDSEIKMFLATYLVLHGLQKRWKSVWDLRIVWWTSFPWDQPKVFVFGCRD